MALTWPASLVPRAAMFRIDARSQTGGPTITGDEQIVQSAAGIWRARLSAITVNNRERILAYRALLAGLDGRFGTVLVPLCDKSRAPLTATTYTVIGDVVGDPPWWKRWDAVIDNETYRYSALAHLGTATIVSLHSFDWAPSSGTPAIGDYVTLSAQRRRLTAIDGTRHIFEPPIVPGPVATLGTASTTLNASAAAQATTVIINRSTGSVLLDGMYFSTPSGRLHIITVVEGFAGNIFTCTIRPPLRAALSAGTVLNMVTPVCEMRLASDDTGELELQMLKQGQATLEFVEA